MSKTLAREHRIRLLLEGHAERLVRRLTELEPSISEGRVLTYGPPPYRRLDCDGRALAYLRCRPRKLLLRVDLSGLWCVPPSPLIVESASGRALLLQGCEQVDAAVAFLHGCVIATRKRSAEANPMG